MPSIGTYSDIAVVAMLRAFYILKGKAMSKRQPRILHNPDLVFNDKASVPILELNIGKLTEEHRHDWIIFIAEPTKKWIKKTKFKGKGTIWTIINPSLNFNNEWAQTSMIIVQGFRENFFEFLYRGVKAELGNLLMCLDSTVIHKDIDGWSAILHVQKGQTYTRVDALGWEEV